MGNRAQDRSVIVTGGSKGIGLGVAKVFASEGARVLLVGRNSDTGEPAARAIVEAGGVASFFRGDVSVPGEVEAMVEAAVDRHGGIDVLCSNAGIFPSARLDEMTEAEWDEVNSVNLKGTFLTVKACLPELRQSDAGRVLLTSSITGPTTGYPGWAHYGATKAGMLGFMRTAAIELARDDITINAVLPGNIITEGLEDVGDEYLDTMTRSIPMGRLGDVEDIGYAMLFLASDEAKYITGQTLVVDGGQTLPESIDAVS